MPVQGGKGCKENVINPVCTRILEIEWEGQGRLCIEWMSEIGGDFEIEPPQVLEEVIQPNSGSQSDYNKYAECVEPEKKQQNAD